MAKKATRKRSKDISAAVREVCLWFPEAEEVMSHGSPDFRVRGKTFATYSVNHHGDGRIALLLHSPPGTQQFYTENEPDAFYVPPYVGPKGWLGVLLDKGLSWDQIASLTRDAYEHVAPASLRSSIGDTISISPPTMTLHPEDIDPLNNAGAQKKLQRLEAFCLKLPEVVSATTFGTPTFKAGKKSFCTVHRRDRKMRLSVWVGVDAQPAMTLDKRFRVPAYTGHNGWIELNIEKSADWPEIESLVLASYKHFALKRMLNALPDDQA